MLRRCVQLLAALDIGGGLSIEAPSAGPGPAPINMTDLAAQESTVPLVPIAHQTPAVITSYLTSNIKVLSSLSKSRLRNPRSFGRKEILELSRQLTLLLRFGRSFDRNLADYSARLLQKRAAALPDLLSAADICTVFTFLHTYNRYPPMGRRGLANLTKHTAGQLAYRGFELGAEAFTPAQALHLLCILGVWRLPKHFELHRFSHLLYSCIGPSLIDTLRNRPSLLIPFASNLSRYDAQGKLVDMLSQCIEESLSSFSLAHCSVLLRIFTNWDDAPLSAVEGIVHRALHLSQNFTSTEWSVMVHRNRKDTPMLLAKVFMWHTSLNHPSWRECHLLMCDTLTALVKSKALSVDASVHLAYSMLRRKGVIPLSELNAAILDRVLSTGLQAGNSQRLSTVLVFAALTEYHLDESVKNKLIPLFCQSLSRITQYAFAAGLFILNVASFSTEAQFAVMERFMETAIALPPTFLVLATRGLSTLGKIDPIVADAIVNLFSENRILRQLSCKDVAHVLNALVAMGNDDGLVRRLLVRRTLAALEQCDDPKELSLLVEALRSNFLLNSLCFNRVASQNISLLAQPLSADLAQAFYDIALQYTLFNYQGSSFDDLWVLMRAKVIDEAHQLPANAALVVLSAFSLLDVDDAALIAVLRQRLASIWTENAEKKWFYTLLEGQLTAAGASALLVHQARFLLFSKEFDMKLNEALLLHLYHHHEDLYPSEVIVAIEACLVFMAEVSKAPTSSSVLDPELLHQTYERLRNCFVTMNDQSVHKESPNPRKVAKSVALPPPRYASLLAGMASANFVDFELIQICKKFVIPKRKQLSISDLISCIVSLADLQQLDESTAPLLHQCSLLTEHLEAEDIRAVWSAVAFARVENHQLLEQLIAQAMELCGRNRQTLLAKLYSGSPPQLSAPVEAFDASPEDIMNFLSE